jgi:NAD(P)H dehydrogenase (quinone)
MQLSLILAHPQPGSFNHAIAEAACAEARARGHDVRCHDLYAERFDPVLPGAEIPEAATLDPRLELHCREIAEADGIVIVHPNWWGQPPALMKGWIDRVIRPGVAYRFLEGDGGEGVPIGLLRARAALVFNTSNTPPEREQQAFGDPLEAIWKRCVFGLCGVTTVQRETFSVVVTSRPDERAEWLSRVRAAVGRCFPGDARADGRLAPG